MEKMHLLIYLNKFVKNKNVLNLFTNTNTNYNLNYKQVIDL